MCPTIAISVLLLIAIGLFLASRSIKIPDIVYGGYDKTRVENKDEINGRKGAKLIGTLVAGVLAVIAVIWLLLTMIFPQTVGEARVIVNADGSIAGEKLDSGWGVKAPWQTTNDWDLFAKQANYAGNAENGSPSYTDGSIQGYEITSQVKGGAEVNFDLGVTYDQDPTKVTQLYTDFRSQDLFVQNVINQQILTLARRVPTAYTPEEFRGEKNAEATATLTKSLNDAFEQYGVKVSVVNLQNIRYSPDVEASLEAVEVANRKEQEAQANLRATNVSAQAQVVEAQAEADANRLRSSSITPELIEANRVEALKAAAEKGSLIVVPDGSSPLIQVPQPAQPAQ